MTASETVRGEPGEDGRDGHQSRMFWRYWTAMTVSGLGDGVTTVALPLLAVQVLHASSFEVSLITAAGFLAWIVIGLPAGVIVHRLPLRGTQVAMDLIRAGAVLSIPIAAVFDAVGLGQLIAVALVIGFASVVFDVGNSTFLPSIVSPQELTARNSLTSGSHAVTGMAGPSLGGVLVQLFGAVSSLVVDTASYLVSALLLQALPRPARPAPVRGGPSSRELIREGWHYVVRHEVIRPCLGFATATNFVCGGLLALTPVFLVRTLHAPAGLVGLLIATDGLGAVIGATLTTRLAGALGTARAMLWADAFGAATALLMPLARPGWGLILFALGNAGFAAGVVVGSIVTRTHRQTSPPPEMLPRVMATVRFVSWGAIPVGAVTAGLVAGAIGNRGAFWVVCLLAGFISVALWSSSLGRRRDLEDVMAG